MKKKMMEKRKGLTPDLTGKGIQERKNILKTAKFISEDLTPFRSKIFRYVKKWNDENHKWDVVATNYGKICCKIKNVGKNGYLLQQQMTFLTPVYLLMMNLKTNFKVMLLFYKVFYKLCVELLLYP